MKGKRATNKHLKLMFYCQCRQEVELNDLYEGAVSSSCVQSGLQKEQVTWYSQLSTFQEYISSNYLESKYIFV